MFTGENSFEIQRALHELKRSLEGEIVEVDGSELELRSIPDLLMGMSLFSTKRAVIIRGLSENKVLWTSLVDWLPRVSDDITLILIEPKPDKRMLTFKELKKLATIREFPMWGERDSLKAEKFVSEEATLQNVVLDKKSIQFIVRRVGVDQWQLYHAIEKLALVETVTIETIEEVIDAQPSENVFGLFETALDGNTPRLLSTLRTLELSQDPYALFGLLSGQAFQLGAVSLAGPQDNVAKDFAIHPFVASKLTALSREKSKVVIRTVISIFAKADDDLKTSRAEPWILIEGALLKIAAL